MSKTKRQQQRFWLLIAFIILIYGASQYQPQQDVTPVQATAIAELYQQQQSDVLVEVNGEVTRVLGDDNRGSRHQRFIIKLIDGHTLLVAHNIDLAPRIENLATGDKVTLSGEYEWNKQGGVIHWTHHDPDNKHPHGWIRHRGKLYQ